MFAKRLTSAAVCAVAIALTVAGLCGDAAADTRLKKKQERKFPTEWCPIHTPFFGSFTSETGCILLTFVTTNGFVDTEGNVTFFDNRLDDVVVIEASEFVSPNIQDSDCYNDETVPELVASYPLTSNPAVALYESFDPLLSPFPWDETQGATINAVDGWIELGDAGLGDADVQTSVVVSGLTPELPYVIHGRWHCNPLFDGPGCVDGSACLEIIVEDLDCPVPVEESTWGNIKSLYTR